MGMSYATYNVPRPDFGAAAQEYFEQPDEFIGLRVAPLVSVPAEAGKYAKITREQLLSLDGTGLRAANGAYEREDLTAEDATYVCEEYGREFRVDDKQRAKYANDFDYDLEAIRHITRHLKARHEYRIQSAVFNTTTFTGSACATAVSWSTVGEDPINNLNSAIDYVRKNIGMRPNTMIITPTLLNILVNQTDIKNRMWYVREATTPQLRAGLADMIGIENLLIAGGVYNSAVEGTAHVGANIWGETSTVSPCVICVTAPEGSGVTSPGLIRTLAWTQDAGAFVTSDTYREETTRSTIYRVRQNLDEVLMDKYFGHMLLVTYA